MLEGWIQDPVLAIALRLVIRLIVWRVAGDHAITVILFVLGRDNAVDISSLCLGRLVSLPSRVTLKRSSLVLFNLAPSKFNSHIVVIRKVNLVLLASDRVVPRLCPSHN